MKSERRDTPRIPIALEAILDYNRQDPQPSVTRDISLDGVFVETRSGTVPRKGALDIAIKLPGDGGARYHRFHAQVVRVTDRGAALVFDRVETDSYAALLDLVFSRRGRSLS
ncbi:MAG TPA: PilZ domain-containing protein [Burkholderiales bacterium]